MSILLSVVLAVSLFGVVALAFSNYRYLLGYFALGFLCCFWLESMHQLVVFATSLTGIHSYMLASVLAILPFIARFALEKPIFYRFGKKILKHHAKPTRMAGARPYNLERDTSFYQHFVRHTPMNEPK